jgi:sulfoxide reductase catalytic subunit YedY
MNRRRFLSLATGTSIGLAVDRLAQAGQHELLVPSDVPDEFGFRIMWYVPVRPLDPSTYQLKVGGLVESPQSFSLAQLRRFPQETQSSRLKCVQCWSSRATWGGFHFGHLLEVVKPLRPAKAIRIDCADKWYEYMSLEEVQSPRVLLVLDMEGKPLTGQHGAPLRLIDPSKYGYKSAKLITSIEFVTEGKGSMACDFGSYYSASGEILPGYDHPLDLGGKVRKKITGGEIGEY